MRPEAIKARRNGRAVLVAQATALLSRPRLVGSGLLGAVIGIAATLGVLGLQQSWSARGERRPIGPVDVAAAVVIGFGVGLLVVSACALVWRTRDLSRAARPPFRDVLLAERYMASIREARDRGTLTLDAKRHAEQSLREGERVQIIDALDDQVVRQSLNAIVLTLPFCGLLPAMVGIYILDGDAWMTLIWTALLLLVQIAVLNVRLWEDLGFATEVADELRGSVRT